MESITYIIKICYQVLVTAIMGMSAFYCYNHSRKLSVRIGHASIELQKKESITFLWILLFCVLEGFYAYLCGEKGRYIFDRAFYAKRFSLGIFTKSSSLGLFYVQRFLHNFTNNPDVLFFSVGAIYMFITVLAYNNYNEKEPQTWFLICASQYLLFGCYQLKQAIASAFVGLSIAFFSRNKKKGSIIFLTIAIVFHEAAWVLVPVYVIIFNSNTKWLRRLGYIFLFILVFSFQSLSTLLIRYASGIIPGLSEQLQLYVSESGELITENNIMTIFKGIPYYNITIEGFVYRKNLKKEILHYDAYLLISTFVSITTFLSGFMYWMWRFGELAYLPTFIFAAKIYKNRRSSNARLLFWTIICFLAIFTYRKLFISYFSYGGLV